MRLDRDQDGRFVPGVCYSPGTQFKPGERTSVGTEFKPGERRSVATEFKAGQPARNKLPLGSVTERRDQHGNMRAWVKVAEPNCWKPRALKVWEDINGPLPRGKVVHHRDRNSINDEPGNLIALTRKEHAAAHRDELNESRPPEVFKRAWQTRRQRSAHR